MRPDIVQTLVAASVIFLIFLVVRQRVEGFADQTLKVIPEELTADEATKNLYQNITFEISTYLKPAVEAINKILSLRPKIDVDKTLINVSNTMVAINSSQEQAIVKILKMADALPSNVDIYKSTLDKLIRATMKESELLYTPNTTSGFIDMSALRKNPKKTVNDYYRVSNTRISSLNTQADAFQKSLYEFEVAFAQLKTLIEQSK